MPISQLNPDGSVKIYNTKTGATMDVPPQDLPKYNPKLVGEYQAKLQEQEKQNATLDLIKSGAVDLKEVAKSDPLIAQRAVREGVPAVAEDKKAKDAKSDTLKKAQTILSVLDQKKSGQLDDKQYKDALNAAASSFTASKAFSEGGKNLTANELAVLTGQVPVIEKTTGNVLERGMAWLQGREVPQKGNVVDDEQTLRNKMILAINALDPNAKMEYPKGSGKSSPSATSGIVQNAGRDAKEILNGILNIPKAVGDTVMNAGNADPRIRQQALDNVNPVNVAGKLGKGALSELNQLLGRPLEGGDVVGRAVNRAYEKPVTTALDVLPFLPKVGRAGAGASTAVRAGEDASMLGKAGEALTQGVRKIDTGPSVYGVSKEASINKTLDDLGIKGSAQQQYAQLEPKMAELGDEITKRLATSPKQVPISKVTQDFEGNLQDQLRTGNLSSKTAQKEVKGYIQDLYGSKLGDEISTPELFDLKQKINQDYQGVAKKKNSGSPLTDREKVISAARQTIDDIISEYHPDVKQATVSQSKLYDAAESLYKSRSEKGPGFSIGGIKFGVPGDVAQKGKSTIGEILKAGGRKKAPRPSSPSLRQGSDALLRLLQTSRMASSGESPR